MCVPIPAKLPFFPWQRRLLLPTSDGPKTKQPPPANHTPHWFRSVRLFLFIPLSFLHLPVYHFPSPFSLSFRRSWPSLDFVALKPTVYERYTRLACHRRFYFSLIRKRHRPSSTLVRIIDFKSSGQSSVPLGCYLILSTPSTHAEE